MPIPPSGRARRTVMACCAPMSGTRAHIAERLLAHATGYRRQGPPAAALDRARVYVQDSLGVALSGTRVPSAPEVAAFARGWGAAPEARSWLDGERLPAGSAAFVNGWLIHNQEFDCLHERAVVHPMAVILAALLARADALGGVGGDALLRACILSVDVAATLGLCARNRLRFFRPAQCGALGAVAGLWLLEDLPQARLASAWGLAYSQLSGTMQAHREGTSMLPLQIGFNARAALDALRLASAGIDGPLDFLEGPQGYFTLFDDDPDFSSLEGLAPGVRMLEISHKPFPSGRATHGALDGVLTLKRQHGFATKDLRSIVVHAPPLVRQLVDRAATASMTPAYARLCLPYVVACALLNDAVNVADFEERALRDPVRLALAQRVSVAADANADLNALAPQRVRVTLEDGTTLDQDLPAVLGSPQRPLTREQHLDKFRAACASARKPRSAASIQALAETVDQLDSLRDVRVLIDRLLP